MDSKPRKGCTYTPTYSPGFVTNNNIYNYFYCNHALDLFQLTSSFYKLLFNRILIADR